MNAVCSSYYCFMSIKIRYNIVNLCIRIFEDFFFKYGTNNIDMELILNYF